METLKILMTGANSDLGYPLAHELFHKGHRLYLHYHKNAHALETLKGDSVFLYKADLSEDRNCAELVNNAVDHMHGIDVVINVIGPYVEHNLLTLSPKEWRMIIDLNLNVTFSVSAFSLPHIMHAKGHIINFCYDGVEAIRSWHIATAYGAAKAGVAILTKSLANALASVGARANAICPGYIDFGKFKDASDELLRKIPMGRYAAPEEVVQLITWLIEESPIYITGALLPIGGGFEHDR